MITRTIKVRKLPVKTGRMWYVHVPLDLRHLIRKSRQTFAAKTDADAFAKDLSQKRALIEAQRQYRVIFNELAVDGADA